MLSDAIAQELRAKGHDVTAVVADPALVSLPDDQILAHAASAGRALVTANIKDFMPLDGQYRAAGQSHAGLILVVQPRLSRRTAASSAQSLAPWPHSWTPTRSGRQSPSFLQAGTDLRRRLEAARPHLDAV